MTNFLTSIDLFQNLSQSDLRLIKSQAQLKTFPAKSMIFKTGERIDTLYLLKRGLVRLFNKRTGTTKEETVCLIGNNQHFCLAPLLTRELTHINAQTLEESEIVLVPKTIIEQLIQKSHQFAQNVIRNLANQECNLCDEVCNLSLSSTKERLAKYLWKTYQKAGGHQSFVLSLNQSQLASHLGTTREGVSRQMGALKKAKIIAMNGQNITILDLQWLEQVGGARKTKESKYLTVLRN